MTESARATAEPWIAAEDAAAHLGIAVGTLYNRIAAGEDIPHRRLGQSRTLRFRRSELDAWMNGEHPVEVRAATAMADVVERQARTSDDPEAA